ESAEPLQLTLPAIPAPAKPAPVLPVRESPAPSENEPASVAPAAAERPPATEAADDVPFAPRVASAFSVGEFKSRYPTMDELLRERKVFEPSDLVELSRESFTEDDIELAAQKYSLREKLFGITVKLNALDEGGRVKGGFDELRSKLTQITIAEKEVDVALKRALEQHRYWAQKAKQLQNENPLALASELSELSSDIQARKVAYEQASSRYLTAVEHTPSGAKELGAALQQRRDDLRAATASFVQYNLTRQLTNLINLSLVSESIAISQARLQERVRIYQNTSSTEDRDELMGQREELESELLELEEQLPKTREEQLRRVWSLQSLLSSRR
ncbi:MAG: hypothetical protein KDD69_19270, partial [Bdellovibrionales bacterium]|nr:hypothetical protein [Bdellovibrionales bacterium]